MTTTPMAFWSELSKPDEGSETDDWAPEVIAVWDAWDRMLGGIVAISVTSADVTLTTTQAQYGAIEATGSPAAARNLIFPAKNRKYIVRNATTQDLFCYVTGFSANKVHVPPGVTLAFATEAAGTPRAIGPQMVRNGGFPSTILHPGKSYSGPGAYFGDDVDMGLARRASGQMGICLADSEGRDSLRFNAGASATTPTIAMGSSFNDGLYPDPTTGGLAWATGGSRRGALADGLVVGAPTGGDKGIGTINTAADYHRNNVRLAFQRSVTLGPYSYAANATGVVAHGLGAVPTLVQQRFTCLTADQGYVPGHVITNVGYVQMIVDGTNLTWRVGAAGVTIINLSNGAAVAPTTGRWSQQFVVYY
jgi:hypothetical protein